MEFSPGIYLGVLERSTSICSRHIFSIIQQSKTEESLIFKMKRGVAIALLAFTIGIYIGFGLWVIIDMQDWHEFETSNEREYNILFAFS